MRKAARLSPRRRRVDILAAVSLTKVAKKTREQKNALLQEVRTPSPYRTLYVLTLSGARKCRQMAILLVVRSGKHAEHTFEDSAKTMERVRLAYHLSTCHSRIPHSNPTLPLISAPRGCSLVVVQLWQKLSVRRPKKSTDQGCTNSQHKLKAKSDCSSPTPHRPKSSSGSQTSSNQISPGQGTAQRARSSYPQALS